MSGPERIKTSEQRGENSKELEAQGDKLRANLERSHEQSRAETNKENAAELRHEAEKHAESKAERAKKQEKAPAPERKNGRQFSKRAQKAVYKKELNHIQANMSAPSRAFSKVIHTPGVEKASEIIGSTAARPNALLSGAVFALIFTVGVYWVAKTNGYPLSGAESIASFFVGYAVGILYDYLRIMIRGRA